MAGTKLYCSVTEAHMCVNNLSRVAARKLRRRKSILRPADRKSNALTTMPRRHTISRLKKNATSVKTAESRNADEMKGEKRSPNRCIPPSVLIPNKVTRRCLTHGLARSPALEFGPRPVGYLPGVHFNPITLSFTNCYRF